MNHVNQAFEERSKIVKVLRTVSWVSGGISLGIAGWLVIDVIRYLTG